MTTHVSHGGAGTPLWASDGDAATRTGRDAGTRTQPLPRLRDPTTHDADLVVVGLGGTGLAAIEAGLEAGMRVVGIDAGAVADGAAGRNGGLLLAGMAAFHHDAIARHGHRVATAWYRATMRERDRLVDADPDLVRRTGSLRVAVDADEVADLDAMARAMASDGLPVQRTDHPMGPALLFPGDAACNPRARCRRLAGRVTRAGARLLEHAPVLDVAAGRVVTATATVHAPTIAVCVDGGLGRLVPAVADQVRPVRLQMVGTSPVAAAHPTPVYARGGLDYWQQLPDGTLAVGGGRDHGGVDEETSDPTPGGPVQSWLDALVARVAPTATITHRWAAIVGFTADGMPVCTQVDEGVFALGGYSGTGNVVGPLLARQVVTWAITGTPPPLLSTLGLTDSARPAPDTQPE